MYRYKALYLIGLLGFAASVEAINISGKVSNQTGKPLQGAIVTLLGKNMKDTTDAQGAYSISDGNAAVDFLSNPPCREEISFINGVVRFSLIKPSLVRIDFFDIKGNLLKRAFNRHASAGEYSFTVIPDAITARMMAIRVSIGGRSSIFRCLPLPHGGGAISSSTTTVASTIGGFAKIKDAVDSLKVSASNYRDTVVPVFSYENIIDVNLDTMIINLPKFSFFVTSLKAVLELSGSPNGFGGDLRFGKTGPGAGLRGADSICECIAERSMKGSRVKQWRAFLSVSSDENGKQVNAIDRIGKGPWYDRMGRLVSNNISDLLNTRPASADPEIKNDLPNEDGIPNHRPDPNKPEEDNHHMMTGTGPDGKLKSADRTCKDWTSVAAGSNNGPHAGLSWPRIMGGRDMGSSWMSGINCTGCKAGVAIVESGGPSAGCDHIGCGGGYGGFYCFALTP